MVYVAAAAPLELVPWREDSPGFYVSELHESEVAVRKQFAAQHVVYVGAHEGCGCGFQTAKYPEPDPKQLARCRRSLGAFATYLADQLRRVPFIELFACWDGDQSSPPEHRRTLTPHTLNGDGFFFLEKEFSRVESGAV